MIAAAEKDAIGNRLGGDEDLAVKDLFTEIGLDENGPPVVDGAFEIKAEGEGICVAVRGHADALVVGIRAYGLCIGVNKDAGGNGQVVAGKASPVSAEEGDAEVREMEGHGGQAADIRRGNVELLVLHAGGD